MVAFPRIFPSRGEAPPSDSAHRSLWSRRRVRWSVYGLGVILVLIIAFWAVFVRGLPDAKTLLTYEPPLPTVVRDNDGAPVYSYARERRGELQYIQFPQILLPCS